MGFPNNVYGQLMRKVGEKEYFNLLQGQRIFPQWWFTEGACFLAGYIFEAFGVEKPEKSEPERWGE